MGITALDKLSICLIGLLIMKVYYVPNCDQVSLNVELNSLGILQFFACH